MANFHRELPQQSGKFEIVSFTDIAFIVVLTITRVIDIITAINIITIAIRLKNQPVLLIEFLLS